MKIKGIKSKLLAWNVVGNWFNLGQLIRLGLIYCHTFAKTLVNWPIRTIVKEYPATTILSSTYYSHHLFLITLLTLIPWPYHNFYDPRFLRSRPSTNSANHPSEPRNTILHTVFFRTAPAARNSNRVLRLPKPKQRIFLYSTNE